MKKIYGTILAILMLVTLTVVPVYATNKVNNVTSNELKEQRTNKYLSSLEIDGYELSPEFNKNTMEYYVIIPQDINSLDIVAEPEVEGAVVRISGNKNLKKKENTITVRVAAIDGTSRAYTIVASKEPKVTLKLESLEIEGITLNEEFSPEKYAYSSSIEDTELTKLNVKTVVNDPNAKVEIIGADNLKDGDNLINIILTNDYETTIYQVDLAVDKLGEKEKEVDNVITRVRKIFEYVKIGGIILIVCIILIIIITIIVKKTKKKKED